MEECVIVDLEHPWHGRVVAIAEIGATPAEPVRVCNSGRPADVSAHTVHPSNILLVIAFALANGTTTTSSLAHDWPLFSATSAASFSIRIGTQQSIYKSAPGGIVLGS